MIFWILNLILKDGKKEMPMYEEIVAKYKATQQATADVLKTQIPTPRALEEEEMEIINTLTSKDLTALSDEELMKHFNLFTGMLSYVEWEEARADIECTTAKNVKEFTFDQVVLQAPDNLKSADRSRWARNTQIVRDTHQEYLTSEAKWKLLKGLKKGYEEKAKMLSREVSRRMGNAQIFGRSMKTT